MKKPIFLLLETGILLLCVILLFLALLYQPNWTWVSVPSLFVVSFVFIAKFSGAKQPSLLWGVVFLAPFGLVAHHIFVIIQTESSISNSFFAISAYYIAGVVLLGAHLIVNIRRRLI